MAASGAERRDQPISGRGFIITPGVTIRLSVVAPKRDRMGNTVNREAWGHAQPVFPMILAPSGEPFWQAPDEVQLVVQKITCENAGNSKI
jgi:hypothetical protein